MITGPIYLILSANEVTYRLLNLSTSARIEECAKLPNGRVVLEYYGEDVKAYIMDYRWYTATEVDEIRAGLEASADSKWWRFWG
jgi:hypothetical protein